MRTVTWVKMAVAGVTCCVGGPALIYYVTPTEEELFKRYNPELQRRSLERRQGNQEEFEVFVNKLKEYSKDEKPIWTAWEQDVEKRRREGVLAELERRKAADAEAEARRQEIRNSIK
ncbi:CBP4-domain-containing protein [Dissoconium aciculare CBS 342.82]|uniref:Cytochrome b mRNA-processing protein 4 n=1 Tax=Dissoconium aciculare CBS 342.82 TaxID=1314786 RepID=A0A6J3MJX4_9PEZI|nr:CBP4-domain-containing protein [Dissoconium aciculare CBS 342.82]KAF1827247.1 CBP4-domain-containing protein [Dissoconium aciculare CBS 342.82]